MSSDGYVDLQVNGYGGVDFNRDGLSAEGLHVACVAMARDGVAGALATIITDDARAMCMRIARIAALREADPLAARIFQGIHIEGPFISDLPGYRGAHPPAAILTADVDTMQRLLDAGQGLVRLVTLAPERDEAQRVTRLLSRLGILVSAGHTDASLDVLRAAIDAGLSVATHVGNGCPITLPRHDNIIQRLLSLADRLTLCFIADGVHVPFFALKNYLPIAGIDRCVVVTDAMSAAGMGPGRYRLGKWDLDVGEDLAVWAPDGGHLVGSAGTMRRSAENLSKHIGLDADACRALLIDNPRRLIHNVATQSSYAGQ